MTPHNRLVCLLAAAWLTAVIGACAPVARTTTLQATATPLPQPASLRIAYTSDCWGNTDPLPAVDCG